MSTTLQPSRAISKPERVPAELFVRNMWAGLAIVVMWLAVLFDALFGPDIVITSGAGTNTTTIPSAVAVALFAWLATKAVAKHGFSGSDHDAEAAAAHPS
jgi:hypothetical protein